MKKAISILLIVASLISCLASCKPTEKPEESSKPEIIRPENPDKTLLGKTKETYEDGNVGCTGLTILAECNEGVDFDINSYKDEENKIYYLFLPCRADMSSVTFKAKHRDGSESGPYTADFSDEEISENEKAIGTTSEYTIIAMQSNLPSIMIEIDESYVTLDQMYGDPEHDTYAYGDMVATVTTEMANAKGWETRYESVDKKANSYCSMKIRGRGNSTWGYSKKPYQINLENSVDLLGMGSSKKYVLLANYIDASGLRTQLAFDMGLLSGIEYTSEHRQVDLFINGEYLGMYLLAEKVEVGENRVDIDEEKDVLYEKDNFATQEENFSFQTKHVNSKERGFRIHSPEDESSFSENKARIEWAEEVLYGINDAMFEQYFDLESWAKMYLLQLYTMNSDAYYGSFYFYYNHTDGKLYACSPWDFDWSLGVSWGNTDFYVNPMLYDIDHIEWIKPMLEHKNFIEAVLKVYYEDGVKEIIEGMPELVDKHGQENRASGLMNEIVNDIYCYPTDITDYDGSVAYVREVCVKRIEYVENKMEVYALLFGYNAN